MPGASTQNESRYEKGPPSRPIPGAVLVFSGNEPKLSAFEIGTKPLVIHRDELGLSDGQVSRPHAMITFDAPGWTVKSLSTKNGTFVQGKEIPKDGETRAASGNVIRCGRTLFVLFDDVRRFLTAPPPLTEPWVIGPSLRPLLDGLQLAAQNGRTVLLGGENGTGKDVAAQWYHAHSGRRGPFLAQNCANLVPTLADAQLFGSRKDIYTGAKDRDGLVQSAEGGTLFLDEIGELDLDVQAKLLRMLETREVQPLGATQSTKIDVRVIAATNRDLRAEIGEGNFREDLYFRLAQVEARMPALRERLEEIPWLISAFLRNHEVRTAHALLVEAALLRPWPGNVRDLKQKLEVAADKASAEGKDVVRLEHLAEGAGLATGGAAATRPKYSAPATEPPPGADGNPATREQVLAALEACNWNVAETQRRLGIKNRTTLVRLMKKYDLVRPQSKALEGEGEDLVDEDVAP